MTVQRTSAPFYLPVTVYGGGGGTFTRIQFVYVPKTFQTTPPPPGGWPLMIVFHGNGGSGRGMEYKVAGTAGSGSDIGSGFDAIADANNFVVMYAQGKNTSWDSSGGNDDITYIVQYCIPAVQRHLNGQINPYRIYICGYSQGGNVATLCLSRYPGKFAGIGIVDTNLGPATAPTLIGLPPLPVWITHGTADPVIPYNGGTAHSGAVVYSFMQSAQLWAQLNNCPDVNNPAQVTTPSVLNTGETSTNTQYTYAPGTPGYPVVAMSVTDGGHTWPGGSQGTNAVVEGQSIGPTCVSFSASQAIWDTVSPYSAPSPYS